MVEIKRGLKAGLAAVLLAALIFYGAFFTLFLLPYGLASATFKGIFDMVFYLFFTILAWLPVGILSGIVFAALYNKLPTRTSISKGVIFSIIPFLLMMAYGIFFAKNLVPITMPGLANYTELVNQYALLFLFLSLSILACGILLGFFWDKFGPKNAGSRKK